MNVQIVPIAESHAEGFHACLDSVAREKKYLGQTAAMPLQRVRDFVRENVASDAAQFVALDGTKVVGWCDVIPDWAHAIQHRGSLGMGVLASYRGRGVGRQLLVACLVKARSKGITRVELEVRCDNGPAIKLYEKLGFVHETTKRNAMRFDGIYYDTVQMSLVT